MLADYSKAYNKSLFDDGAGAGVSPSWIPGGVFGGVPMGGSKRRKLRKSNKRKSGKKLLRKTKKYSRK